jgi:glycosyltransferase involved in cell wall biosynthesis
MARSVDAVWAGNEYLAVTARIHCPTTVVLPTSVEPASYVGTTPPNGDFFDLVWIGSSSTRKYLEEFLPVLGQAVREIPNLRLKIVADFDLSGASALGVRTLCVRWSTASEAAELASAQVGISPMPENPWTRGKCGLKVLQYMAAGLPVVASAAGVHGDIIVDGQTGFLATDAAAWIAALRRLHSDPSLRAKMGAAGRQRVVENYSVAATFAKMLRSLETITAHTDPAGEAS